MYNCLPWCCRKTFHVVILSSLSTHSLGMWAPTFECHGGWNPSLLVPGWGLSTGENSIQESALAFGMDRVPLWFGSSSWFVLWLRLLWMQRCRAWCSEELPKCPVRDAGLVHSPALDTWTKSGNRKVNLNPKKKINLWECALLCRVGHRHLFGSRGWNILF